MVHDGLWEGLWKPGLAPGLTASVVRTKLLSFSGAAADPPSATFWFGLVSATCHRIFRVLIGLVKQIFTTPVAALAVKLATSSRRLLSASPLTSIARVQAASLVIQQHLWEQWQ